MSKTTMANQATTKRLNTLGLISNDILGKLLDSGAKEAFESPGGGGGKAKGNEEGAAAVKDMDGEAALSIVRIRSGEWKERRRE